jgi:hypothetical protein
MLSVMFLVKVEVAHAEIRREIHDEPARRVEDLAREPRGCSVLEGQEDDVRSARNARYVELDEACVGERGHSRMHLAPRAPGGAPARRRHLRHTGVEEQKAQQLAAGEAGGPDDRDLHARSAAGKLARTTPTSPAGSRRAL